MIGDERKNRINQLKHGIGFEIARRVFDDPLHLPTQDREIDGEARWQTIGSVDGVALLLVVHLVEDDEDEVIRIISARKADRHERRRYERNE